jgi:O-antigen/teichoic acid export membrane protein
VARLLDPADFGLVAMVTAVTGIYDLFSTGGLSIAAVQQATITEKQISTLFWINMLIGILLALLCLLTAPILVHFYREPRLFWVTIVLAAGFIFTAAGAQHVAILQRQLRYEILAAIEALAATSSAAAAIGMAVEGYGYWALVISALVGPAISTAAMWAAVRWVPGMPHRKAGIHPMLHFGGTVTLNNLAVYVASNFDKVLLGRYWGADALGLYGRANQLVGIPRQQLHAAIGGVAFPSLARLQNDPIRCRNYFLKGYSLVISLTTPITLFCVAFADDIILVVLGPKWTEGASIFRLLSPTVLTSGIIDPLGWLLFSLGLQKRCLAIAAAIAILSITAYLIGLPYGPAGVALSFSTAMTLWLVPHVFWCLKGTMVSIRDFLLATWPPVGSAAVAATLAFAGQFYTGQWLSPWWRLLFGACVMGVVYASTLLYVMGQKSFYLGLLAQLKDARTTAH